MMNPTRLVAFSLAILLIMLLAGLAGAGSSASFAIDWQVFSGGGAPATAGNVSLNGSLGQTAIGPSSAGGNVTLGAGFWSGLSVLQAAPGNPVYLPVIIRSS